jgi:drug/metabolite transporter (DMT)-like permease
MMKRWNVCDASWILLGATIILVSLVPAFHRTPWQIALSLGEGWATMVTASACVLTLLLVWDKLMRTVYVNTLETWRLLPAIFAIANVLSIVMLMQDSSMIDTLGRFVAMGGKNAVWVVSRVGAGEGWLTASLWFGGIVVLLALLVGVNAPVIFSIISEWLRKSTSTSMWIPLSPFEMRTKYFYHPVVRWIIKILSYAGLLLVNILYASYSLVSMSPLHRVDPILFVCFQAMILAPIGFALLLRARRHLTRESVYRGLQLGGFLSAELLCYTHSLKDTGMTETMVFSAVNGIVATLIAWKVFGQRISTLTRWACLFALGGAALVWSTSPSAWQGDFTAFMSGVCLTGYSFHIEQLLTESQRRRLRVLPVIGIQFLMTALTTLVIALCFGQWQTIHFLVPSDLVALVYLSLATILLPCLIMLVTQRSISAVTVAFFSVVEPLAGASFAFFSAGERLPMLAYIGGGIVLVGIVLQVMAGTGKKELSPILGKPFQI